MVISNMKYLTQNYANRPANISTLSNKSGMKRDKNAGIGVKCGAGPRGLPGVAAGAGGPGRAQLVG